MLETVLTAELGDEQLDNDPTTDLLCNRVAKLLGKEKAILLPSGTMCNAVALNVHCRPGDAVLCDNDSYIANFEAGGPAAISGTTIKGLDGERGIFNREQVLTAIQSHNRFSPRPRLISVEQTTASGAGAIWSPTQLKAVVDVGHENGLALHMDGARLANAVVASGISAAEHAAGFDSCWIDFAKGLGAPIGAVLAGSNDFIHDAWCVKQRLGGAMHQSGVIAAMCLYGLDNNFDRLNEDHALAASIGDALSAMKLVDFVVPVATNIVIFDISSSGPDAAKLVSETAKDGVVIGALGPRRIRIVTHLGVDESAGTALIESIAKRLN